MSYIFENGNSNKDQQKKTKNSKYTLWMNSILRRSKEIGKVELPICSIILDERGRCIGRGVNRRNINKDPLGHAEIMALRQASLIKNDWRFNECTIITNLEPVLCVPLLSFKRGWAKLFSGLTIRKEVDWEAQLTYQNMKVLITKWKL